MRNIRSSRREREQRRFATITFEPAARLFYIAAGRYNQSASASRARTGKEDGMTIVTRRSVLRSSLGLAAAGTLARPHIANAAATSAEVWFAQGFVPEEDSAFLAMVADYEKASGNKIDRKSVV